MTDHIAEALAALAGAGDGRNVATDAPLVAIAHAAIAIAQQKRIENLLAMFRLDESDASDAVTYGFSYPAALRDIQEGLQP